MNKINIREHYIFKKNITDKIVIICGWKENQQNSENTIFEDKLKIKIQEKLYCH